MTLHARDPMCALAEKNTFNQSPRFCKPLWKPLALRGVSRVVSSNGISPAFVFPKSKYQLCPFWTNIYLCLLYYQIEGSLLTQLSLAQNRNVETLNNNKRCMEMLASPIAYCCFSLLALQNPLHIWLIVLTDLLQASFLGKHGDLQNFGTIAHYKNSSLSFPVPPIYILQSDNTQAQSVSVVPETEEAHQTLQIFLA